MCASQSQALFPQKSGPLPPLLLVAVVLRDGHVMLGLLVLHHLLPRHRAAAKHRHGAMFACRRHIRGAAHSGQQQHDRRPKICPQTSAAKERGAHQQEWACLSGTFKRALEQQIRHTYVYIYIYIYIFVCIYINIGRYIRIHICIFV